MINPAFQPSNNRLRLVAMIHNETTNSTITDP